MGVGFGGAKTDELRLQIAGTNGAFPWLTSTVGTTGKTQSLARIPVVIAYDCSELVLAFDNAYLGASGTVDNVALQSVRVYLEQSSPALSVQIKARGQGTFTIPAGANRFLTDPIYPAAFSQSVFAKDSLWWIRITTTLASSSNWGLGNWIGSYSGADCKLYDPVANPTESNQVSATGAIINIAGASSPNQAVGPTAILGRPVARGNPATLGLGASFQVGTDDTAANSATGPGILARAALPSDGSLSNVIAHTVFKLGGTGIMHAELWKKMIPYFGDCNIFYCDDVANDIGSVGTQTADATYARLTDMWRLSRGNGRGAQKIIQMMVNPRTTSTDSWATVANQTYTAPFIAGGAGDDMNNRFISALATKQIDALHTLNGLRSLTDPWKWIPGGTNAGTHPVPVTYVAVASELRSLIQGMQVR